MKVGALRRSGAYLLDMVPILAILSLLFSLFVGDLLKPENYDVLMDDLVVINDRYNEIVAPYQTQYENEELTIDEYNAIVDPLIEDYNAETTEHMSASLLYLFRTILYYITSSTMLYYIYSVVTKGSTVGRKMMKIELSGNITWFSLFVREVIWKTGYYMMTLYIGGIILDFAMVALSAKKETLRDKVTKIKVKFEGVDYPF